MSVIIDLLVFAGLVLITAGVQLAFGPGPAMITLGVLFLLVAVVAISRQDSEAPAP